MEINFNNKDEDIQSNDDAVDTNPQIMPTVN